MVEPEVIEVRLVHLAWRLRKRSELGRAAWKRGVRRDQFLYTGRAGSVVVERADGADGYTLRVLDRVGNPVERLDVAPPTTGVAATALPPDAFEALAGLFDAARRSARARETVVDELLAEFG